VILVHGGKRDIMGEFRSLRGSKSPCGRSSSIVMSDESQDLNRVTFVGLPVGNEVSVGISNVLEGDAVLKSVHGAGGATKNHEPDMVILEDSGVASVIELSREGKLREVEGNVTNLGYFTLGVNKSVRGVTIYRIGVVGGKRRSVGMYHTAFSREGSSGSQLNARGTDTHTPIGWHKRRNQLRDHIQVVLIMSGLDVAEDGTVVDLHENTTESRSRESETHSISVSGALTD